MSSTTINTVWRRPATTNQVASLKPKEHGAYAIVFSPLIAALITSGIGLVSMAVVVAALAGFLAHEPLLVALGHRGRRLQRELPAARGRASGLLLICVLAGTIAIWFATTETRLSLIGCLSLAIISFGVAIARQHRSLTGQLFGVVGLSFPCVPILLSGGLPWQHALLVWLVWLLGFVSTTLAVRSVIAAQKREPRRLHWSGIVLTTSTMVGFISANIWLPLAALPMIAASWALMTWPPPAKQLRRVGWTLVAATIFTGLMLVIAVP